MNTQTVTVVPAPLLADAAAVLAGTMCTDLQFRADPEDPTLLIRSCVRHNMLWPDGRALCMRWGNEFTQLFMLARAAAYSQVSPTGADGPTAHGSFDDVQTAIAGRHAAATQGPWFWYGDTDTHRVAIAGRQPGAGVTEVLTTLQVERAEDSRDGQRMRFDLMDATGCSEDEADDAVYEWAYDIDGAPRTDSRLALLDPDTTMLHPIEDLAVYTVARQQGLPDDTPGDNPQVYRHSICDVRNANGKFLAASWADVAWLLGQVQDLRNKLAAAEALLPVRGEPRLDDDANFCGLTTGPEDSHRTVGHRAWSDAGTWCYPDDPCPLCQPPVNADALRDALDGKVEGVTHD